ncbi:MAG: chemotaxis protein CheC [Vulcanibacillus sp.]
MSFDINKVKDSHLDILKEIGNIGAGHAATALSKIIQKPIDMNVPSVDMLNFGDLEKLFSEEESVVVGIFLRLDGSIKANLFYIMPVITAKELLGKFFKNGVTTGLDFSEIEISALLELGNILAGSYITSLADFTNLTMYPSVPSMTIDLANAILGFGLIPISQVSDVAILINTRFIEGENYLEGQLFLIPDPDAYAILFSSLGAPLI